jgi:hypothetical protein
MSQNYQEKSVQPPHPPKKEVLSHKRTQSTGTSYTEDVSYRRQCVSWKFIGGKKFGHRKQMSSHREYFQCSGDCGKMYLLRIFPWKIQPPPPPSPFQAVVSQHIGLQLSGFPQVAKCKAQ